MIGKSFFVIDVVNLGHVLIEPKPNDNSEFFLPRKLVINILGMPSLAHSRMNFFMFIINTK